MFPQYHLRGISSSGSDHSAMVLSGPLLHGDAMWMLHQKLVRLGKALWVWSRTKVGNIALLTAVSEQLILGLDYAQDHCDLTIAELSLRIFLQNKLLDLAAIHRVRIRQCSRLLWVRPGEVNAKLFHIKANGRR